MRESAHGAGSESNGIHQRAPQVFGCPECGLPIMHAYAASNPRDDGTLRCGRGHDFAIVAGLPLLVRESDRPRVLAFAVSYGRAWAKDGWGSTDPAYLVNLPYRDVTHRHPGEWRVKARSAVALLSVLSPSKWLRVLDIGCGNGWLSHHLAARGHDVYAMDVVLDDTVGLGAARSYVRLGPPFQTVWGDFDHLPFLSESMDAAVCNASLHYAGDLDLALREIARVLRPGGLVAILNSPVYNHPASAARALSDFRAHLRDLGSIEAVASTYHHFTRTQLRSSVGGTIGPLKEIRFDPGSWFRLSRMMKGVFLRMELASFPVLIATKPEGPPSGSSPGTPPANRDPSRNPGAVFFV